MLALLPGLFSTHFPTKFTFLDLKEGPCAPCLPFGSVSAFYTYKSSSQTFIILYLNYIVILRNIFLCKSNTLQVRCKS